MAPAHPAVIQAAMDGNLRLLKKMASEVDLQVVKDDKGRSVLHFATALGHLEICKFLIEECGFDVNLLALEGETPVLMAAFSGSVPVMQYLIDRGGDPVMATSRGTTPLHEAAVHGHYESTMLLLSKGVPVDRLSCFGTPLHVAVGMAQDKTAKVLLEHGADPNRVVNRIFTPLVVAATWMPSVKCMELLIKAGADVNFHSPFGPSPLLAAVDDGLTDIVKYLLGVGADPNIPDDYGYIPIMWAASSGHRELVEILLPHTKRISSLPDWSVDGIIETMKDKLPVNTMKAKPLDAQDGLSVQERVANMKSQGKEAFTKGDYYAAIHYYGLAIKEDPHDATSFSNRSLCCLKLNLGCLALEDARECKMLRPNWPKAWYREGAAHNLLKNYEGALDAFREALKLDPENDEIKKALREVVVKTGGAVVESV